MATTVAPKLSPALLAEALKREPLVGLTAAANMLGMPRSNFKRDALPHLTEVTVEGSASVYFRSEVTRLAQRRAQDRERRRKAHENGAG